MDGGQSAGVVNPHSRFGAHPGIGQQSEPVVSQSSNYDDDAVRDDIGLLGLDDQRLDILEKDEDIS